jgi:putative MATE family efflux protein
MMIQNGITNLVSLLDNVMVGTLGTESISAVTIVNQFIFVFNLMIFGSISAAGIYLAQYYGSGDENGMRYTFRFKLIITLSAAILGAAIIGIFEDGLIGLFLHESESSGNLALTLEIAKKYLGVILIGLIPYALAQAYGSTLRETGEVFVPMISSIAAVATNFVLNILLIFGLLGFPALGVVGAAIATTVSRFVELFILLIYSHKNTKRFPYIKGIYSSIKIPRALFRKIIAKGIPLLFNESLFGLAIAMRNQCYSTRGLDAVAALNIFSTIFNLFSVIYMALGTSISIIIGAKLGAGKIEEAKDEDRKLITFAVFTGFLITLIMLVASLVFPKFYNTTDEVRNIASFMIVISGLAMPFSSFSHAAYFTLRSGGRILITILFDSVYMWGVVMPVSFIFAYLTEINILTLFIICQWTDALKVIFGAILLSRAEWARAIVRKGEA